MIELNLKCARTALSPTQRGVTADTALRLERYFGSEAQGGLNLQSAYDLRIAESLAGKAIAKEIKPLVLADQSADKQRGR